MKDAVGEAVKLGAYGKLATVLLFRVAPALGEYISEWDRPGTASGIANETASGTACGIVSGARALV